MESAIGLVGFGEAGRTFAEAARWASAAHVFDRKTDDAIDASVMRQRYSVTGVTACDTLTGAVETAQLILSLVTADQALAVAEAVAAYIAPGVCFCDMNSVAPQTKQAAAAVIEAVGAHYIDVAIMATVDPARLAVPLLISGAAAEDAASLLGRFGFTNRRVVGATAGRASAIKMIRSVMVKGVEALTAECVLAADAAGVLEDVLASLDASETSKPWQERADYNLDRMMVHGLRRAAEMDEAVKTLDSLGIGSAMTRGTVLRQHAIGLLGHREPASGLDNKLNQLNAVKARPAWR